MGVVYATTFALILWLLLWAFGIKAVDGFILVLVIVLTAIVGRLVAPLLPGNRQT